jgi:hypothetical protein
MPLYTLPNIASGGSITVSGNSLAEAQQNAASQTGVSLSAQQGGGTFGANTFGGGGGGGGGGGAAPATDGGGFGGGGFNTFAAQTSGVTDKQLAQQKAEFDAQLAFARDQMTQLGIPQLQINQQLAALQQKQFEFQMAEITAGITGTYQGQPTLQALAQYGQLYGQNAPPAAGQQTLAAIQQQANIAAQQAGVQQAWAQLYGQAFPTGQGPTPAQQTLAAQAQQAQLSGMYQGQPTEAAREFNRQLALQYGQLGLQQGQLGQQYLSTAAQLQGPQNTFQLSNYLRGAQGNPAVPTYLQSLANNIALPMFQATGTTAPTTQTAAGLVGQLGGQTSATPGFDYGQTLRQIQNMMGAGAQGLGPGALERLTPDELQALGSGIGAAGGSLPSFLQQYAQSRIGQSAAAGNPFLAG